MIVECPQGARCRKRSRMGVRGEVGVVHRSRGYPDFVDKPVEEERRSVVSAHTDLQISGAGRGTGRGRGLAVQCAVQIHAQLASVPHSSNVVPAATHDGIPLSGDNNRPIVDDLQRDFAAYKPKGKTSFCPCEVVTFHNALLRQAINIEILDPGLDSKRPGNV